MKKRITWIICICAMLLSMLMSVSAETLDGTKIRSSAADPWICYHDGYYYLTVTGSTKIAVFKAKAISDFGKQNILSNIVYDSAKDKTVKDIYGVDARLSGTWSPEIHYFTDEQAPGNSGWYMFLGLRNATGDSSQVQAVVLKSLSGTPKGPYGHPMTGEANRSQVLLNVDGKRYTDWAVGQSILKIPEGKYEGIYTTWITEIGRGQSGADGKFYQKIMIAKLKNPWTLSCEGKVIATPTQAWEYSGASVTHPRVVEGATALYGTRGDVYITYSGSGYWSDYGLGQMTWTGADPMLASSWVKLPDEPTAQTPSCNPIFQAKRAEDLRGCGHASFVCDKDGHGFLVYHAYPYENGVKAKSRNSYIEPYYIDYTQYNGTSYGVIHMGANDNRTPASTATDIAFVSTGDALAAPTLRAERTTGVSLSLNSKNAKGYIIYRSCDGEIFEYLASSESKVYTDNTAEDDKVYYYRAYAYRNQETSPRSETVRIGKTENAPTTETQRPAETSRFPEISKVPEVSKFPETSITSISAEASKAPEVSIYPEQSNIPDASSLPTETARAYRETSETAYAVARTTEYTEEDFAVQYRDIIIRVIVGLIITFAVMAVCITVIWKTKKQ